MRTVSRCISLLENGDATAQAVVEGVSTLAGKALVIGVTGVPGAGKSTLVPVLARNLAAKGYKPAILAVDPSSPISGGAILGDRIRDTSSSAQGALFFRSVASRGSLGGLSKTLEDVVTLLDAAGFDAILIETVGTGQSEIGVTKLAHTTLAVTAPGLGDDIQAMKAGILEVANLLVVNKADSDPRGAEIAAITLRNALADSQRAHGLDEGANPAGPGHKAAWLAPVRGVSALKGEGIDELLLLILSHREFLAETGALEEWRRRRATDRFQDALRDALFTQLQVTWPDAVAAAENDAIAGRSTPIRAAEALARRIMATVKESKQQR